MSRLAHALAGKHTGPEWCAIASAYAYSDMPDTLEAWYRERDRTDYGIMKVARRLRGAMPYQALALEKHRTDLGGKQ